ncbi:hypothetical protein BH10BAC6_BH10BAC6_16960 [soil metagenome]
MSDRRDWWLQRSDADVIDAYVHIAEFEPSAQILILTEFHSRGLDQLGPLPPTRSDLHEQVRERTNAMVRTYLFPTGPVGYVRLIGMACLVATISSFSSWIEALHMVRDYPDPVVIMLVVIGTEDSCCMVNQPHIRYDFMDPHLIKLRERKAARLLSRCG